MSSLIHPRALIQTSLAEEQAALLRAFSGLGSIEVRAITDGANKEAPNDFATNVPVAMNNLARVLTRLFA